jgi:hypothetical protein
LAFLSPEKNQHSGGKRVEVVVPMDLCVVVQCHFAEHLHPNDGVDEEEEHNQQRNVGKGLGKASNFIAKNQRRNSFAKRSAPEKTS